MPEEKVVEKQALPPASIWTAGDPHGHTMDSDEERLRKLEAFMKAVKDDVVLGGILNHSQESGSGGTMLRVPVPNESDWIIQDLGGPGAQTQYAKITGKSATTPFVRMKAQTAAGAEAEAKVTSNEASLLVTASGTANSIIVSKAGGSSSIVMARDAITMLTLGSTGLLGENAAGTILLQLLATVSYLGDSGTGNYIGVDEQNDQTVVSAQNGSNFVAATIKYNDVFVTFTNGGATSTPLRLQPDAGSGKIGFFEVTPVSVPTVTGSRGGNAALASLLTHLGATGLGLIIDGSSA